MSLLLDAWLAQARTAEALAKPTPQAEAEPVTPAHYPYRAYLVCPRYGIEPGGRIADPWEAQRPEVESLQEMILP